MKSRNYYLIIIILLVSCLFSCGYNDSNSTRITEHELNQTNMVLPMDPPIEPESDFEIVDGSIQFSIISPEQTEKVLINISSTDMLNPVEHELIKINNRWEGVVGNLPAGTEKKIQAKAYDETGILKYQNEIELNIVGNNTIYIILQLRSVNETELTKPFINSVIIAPKKIAPGEGISLDVDAVSPQEDELLYSWSSFGMGSFDDGTSATPIWTSPLEENSFEFSVFALDKNNYFDRVSFKVDVDYKYSENSIPVSIECFCHFCWYYYYAPRIKSIDANPSKVKQGEEISLDAEAYDPHDYQLSYRWWVRGKCGYKKNKFGTFTERYNNTTSFRVSKNAPLRWFRIKLRVCNKYYCSMGCKWIKVIKSEDSPPVIDSITAAPEIINAGETTELNVTASDPDGDALSYKWNVGCSGSFSNPESNNTTFRSDPDLKSGKCKLSVIVSDGKSDVSKSINIEIVKQNNPPEIKSITANPLIIDRNETTQISAAADPDNDNLTYQWTSSCSGTFTSPGMANTGFTAGSNASFGNCKISLKVSDGSIEASDSINIEIKNSNTPPEINGMYANPDTVDRTQTSSLSVDAYDIDGDPLTYNWFTNCPGLLNDPASVNPIFTVNADAEYGECTIEIGVSDGTDITSASIPLKIEQIIFNTPPEIHEVSTDPMEILRGESTDLWVLASDIDGDILTYNWTSQCSGSFQNQQSEMATFTASEDAQFGSCTLNISVSDGTDVSNSSISITIIKPNTPPEITGLIADPMNPDRGQVTFLEAQANDADADPLTYSWTTTCSGNFNDTTIFNPEFTISSDAVFGPCSFDIVVNDGKTTAASSITITVEHQNQPPLIQNVTATPEILHRDERSQLNVDASDPDGDPLTYSWSTDCQGLFDNITLKSPGFTTAEDAEYGPCTISVDVSDSYDSVTGSINIEIEVYNIPPVINSLTAIPEEIDRDESTNLNVDASDANGDLLTYSWTTTCEGTFDDPTMMNPVFLAAIDAVYGQCTISVEVNDGKESSTSSIDIMIQEAQINETPIIVSSFQSTDSANPGDSVIFIVRASDPEGTDLSFDWKSTTGTFSTPVETKTESYTESLVFWTAPSCGVDPIVIKSVIADEDNKITEKSFLPVTLIGGPVCPQSDPGISTKLEASDKNRNYKFGYSVSIDGNYLISGAYAKNSYSGSAYIFELENNAWIEKAILNASDAMSGDYFGYSVHINGNFAIVGAMGKKGGANNSYAYAGAAYIFERDESGTWIEKTILLASDMSPFDRFGSTVSISSEYAVVGARYEDGGQGNPRSNSGSVYIYKRDESGQWIEHTILRSSDAAANDYFGSSVQIKNNKIIIGAYGKDVNSTSDAGGAYIYELDENNSWIESAILHSPEIQAYDRFGNSVSIDNNQVVIGAYMEDGGSGSSIRNAGSAYVFSKNTSNGSWFLTTILRARDKESNDYFGSSVSIYGNYMLISAQREDGGDGSPFRDSGAVYIYKKNNNGSWAILKSVYAPDRQASDMLGNSVSLSGSLGILGAYGEDGGNGNPYQGAGSIYILDLFN